jgi:glutamate-1-semialdehyde aminotransferase
MAAALTTIKIMERENVCDKLWSYGRRLKEAIETSARAYNLPVLCHGNAVRFVIKFTRFDSDPEFGADPGYLEDLAAKSLFLQEMVKRGVLMGVPTFSTASHTTKDLLTTTKAIDETFAIMAAAKGDYASKLEGACLGAPVIRK